MRAHIEPQTLSELRLLMEDEFPTLVQAYLNDSERRIVEMAEAIGQADLEALRRAAHSLKGSSSNLGAMTLSALCLALEQQTKRGELFGAEEQVLGIREEFLAVANALRAELVV